MDFKKAAFLGIAAAATAFPVLGYTLSLPFRIRYERVYFSNLPGHLSGLKILHISDFHARYPHKMHMDIWSSLMALNFDMAVITGDIILNDIRQLRPHLSGLRQLSEKAPVFYVDGNHESGMQDHIGKIFTDIGVIPLYNRRGSFMVGSNDKAKSPIVSVAGFMDYNHLADRNFKEVFSLMDDLAKNKGFHIILSHQPQIFDWFKKGKIPFSALILAGHTHGGQVRLPFAPTLFAPGQGIFPGYGDGWFQREDGTIKMFISRGIGATYFPIRMFNPPEIVIIEVMACQ